MTNQNPNLALLDRDFQLRPVQAVALYVHIPFCTSRCRYCNFYLETGWSPRVLSQTLDTILRQSAALIPKLFPNSQPQVTTVYFGGGTPSVIPPPELDRFLSAFRQLWQPGPVEWTVEANPESLRPELLEVLAKHGIQRLSLGVQTRNAKALRILGRRAKVADIEAALQVIGTARRTGLWTGQLNCDLITGLPELSTPEVAADARYLVDQGADHVSVYSLTVEPGTALAQLRTWQPATPERHEAQWAAAAQVLGDAGLQNYEVSNFARPGAESQHNTGYWRLQPYVGLGPRAVGTLPGIHDGTERPLRLTSPDLFAYNQAANSYELEPLGARDFFLDHLLTGLRTPEGWGIDYLIRVFGPDIEVVVRRLHQAWEQRGLLSTYPNRLALTDAGRLILDPLLADSLAILDQCDDGYWGKLQTNWPVAE